LQSIRVKVAGTPCGTFTGGGFHGSAKFNAQLAQKETVILTQFTNGLDALNALNSSNDGGGNNSEFTPLKSGTTFKVKVVDKAAVQMVYAYGIHAKNNNGVPIHTFVAKNPSAKSAKGNPIENLTPWDKAWKYYADKSEQYQDANSQLAYKFKGKPRFAMAFFNLTDGAPIIVDLTKNQAQAVAASITKYEKKLGKIAFELSKDGDGTATKVSLTPILDMEEDITDKERANFEKAPEAFPDDIFNGIWFEQDETQMLESLKLANFDISLIGYSATSSAEHTSEAPSEEQYEF